MPGPAMKAIAGLSTGEAGQVRLAEGVAMLSETQPVAMQQDV
jgi:hypothetical protein